MGFGVVRGLIRPLSRVALLSTPLTRFVSPFGPSPAAGFLRGEQIRVISPSSTISTHLHSLTDTRYPKRRPVDKPRRKRASLRPPGPYAWVQYVPGQPISPNNPNEGSVKRRNEKKRMRLRRAFILSERKKRKAQMQEATRKKKIKQVERKMAAVARERAWTQRLAELQRLEKENKNPMI